MNGIGIFALCAALPAFGQIRPERRELREPMTRAARLLDQATFGPTPASIAQLQQMGMDAWLNAQFALNTSDIPDQPILDATGKNNGNLAPVQSAFFANAITGEDQLRQRVALALSKIWVVSAVSIIYLMLFLLIGGFSAMTPSEITATLSKP